MVNVRGLVLRAPEQNADLTPVHENEALGLVGDVAAKAATHNAVPRWQVHLVELSFDNLSDVVQHASLLEGKGHTVDGVLLHRLVHVCRLHHGVLCLRLVLVSMGLHHLRVGFLLPLFGLLSTGVSCNLRDRCCH